MTRIRLSPSSLDHLKPIARVSAIAIGSLVPAYLGPVGAYTGVLVGNILGDVISDFLSGASESLFDKIENALYRKLEKNIGSKDLGKIVLRALKGTLDELENEYRKTKVGKVISIFKDPEGVEWFSCILKKMKKTPDKTGEVFKGDIKAVDGETILEFLFSFDCGINDDLREFLRERFPSTFQKHVAEIINTNSKLRLVFYTAVLEILKEHERKFETYFEGLRNLSEFDFLGVEKKLNELVDEILKDPFVGRDEVLNRVEAILEEKENGKIIITGPAGIGKSALMAHIFERISQRTDVVLVPYFFTTSRGRRDLGTALRFIIVKLYLSTLNKPIEDSILSMNNRTLADILAGMLTKQPPKKVAILIDALDEADAKELAEVGYPFLSELPKNVYLIISVRGNSNNLQIPGTLDMIEDWKKGAEIIPLENLGFKAVTSLVRKMLEVPDDELEKLSTAIYVKTKGHPLYLHHLLEELIELKKKLGRGEDVNQIISRIESLPESFEEYIEEQLEIMENVVQDPELLDSFLALLTVVKEPIDIGIAGKILGVRGRKLKRLPHEVKRWFSIEKQGFSERWAFQHEAIRESFTAVLKKEGYVNEVIEKLLAYCERNVKSEEPYKYCLKHYPEHLYEAGKYEELLSLIEDERFLNLQREVGSLPLVLGTLELGINAAVSTREWEELLRLTIVHNRFYSRLPLLDYYRKYGIDSTLNIITREKSERLDIFHTQLARTASQCLLLAAYLIHINNDKDAKEVLRLLDNMLLSSHPLWEERFLISSLLELWQELSINTKRDLFLFLSLVRGLTYQEVISFLLRRNLSREAKLVLDKYYEYLEIKKKRGEDIFWDLIKIAEFFIQIEESRRAKEIIKELISHSKTEDRILAIIDLLSKTGDIKSAVKLAKNIIGRYDRSKAFKIIILNLIQEGEIKRAMEMVENIEISSIYPDIISEICISLARADKIEESLLLMDKITGYQYKYYRVKILAEIIRVLIQKNNEDRAQEILKNALKIAEEIRWEEERTEALKALVDSILYFKKVEEVVMLLDIVHQLSISISNPWSRSEILAEIAKGFARKGFLGRAQEMLSEIKDRGSKFWVMLEAIRVYLNDGDIRRAVELLNRALSLVEEDTLAFCDMIPICGKIYEELASILAQVGDIKLIKNIVSTYHIPELFNYVGLLSLELNRIDIAFELSQWSLLDSVRHRKNSLCDESFVLIELAKDLIAIGEFERALNLVKKVCTTPEILKMSEKLAKCEDFKKIAKILESSLYFCMVNNTQLINFNDCAMGEISLYMAQIGDIETAIKLVEKISYKHLRLHYLEEVLRIIFQSSPNNKLKTILKQLFHERLLKMELEEIAILLPYLLEDLSDTDILSFFKSVMSLEPARFVQVIARVVYNMRTPPKNIINLLLDYVSSYCEF